MQKKKNIKSNLLLHPHLKEKKPLPSDIYLPKAANVKVLTLASIIGL